MWVRHFLTKPIDEEELFSCIAKISAELRKSREFTDCPDVIPYENMLELEEAMDSMDCGKIKIAASPTRNT